jgi:hypothetical protein
MLEVGGDTTAHLSSGAQKSNFHVIELGLLLVFCQIGGSKSRGDFFSRKREFD